MMVRKCTKISACRQASYDAVMNEINLGPIIRVFAYVFVAK